MRGVFGDSTTQKRRPKIVARRISQSATPAMVFTKLARKIAFFPGLVLSLKNGLRLWRNAYFTKNARRKTTRADVFLKGTLVRKLRYGAVRSNSRLWIASLVHHKLAFCLNEVLYTCPPCGPRAQATKEEEKPERPGDSSQTWRAS